MIRKENMVLIHLFILLLGFSAVTDFLSSSSLSTFKLVQGNPVLFSTGQKGHHLSNHQHRGSRLSISSNSQKNGDKGSRIRTANTKRLLIHYPHQYRSKTSTGNFHLQNSKKISPPLPSFKAKTIENILGNQRRFTVSSVKRKQNKMWTLNPSENLAHRFSRTLKTFSTSDDQSSSFHQHHGELDEESKINDQRENSKTDNNLNTNNQNKTTNEQSTSSPSIDQLLDRGNQEGKDLMKQFWSTVYKKHLKKPNSPSIPPPLSSFKSPLPPHIPSDNKHAKDPSFRSSFRKNPQSFSSNQIMNENHKHPEQTNNNMNNKFHPDFLNREDLFLKKPFEKDAKLSLAPNWDVPTQPTAISEFLVHPWTYAMDIDITSALFKPGFPGFYKFGQPQISDARVNELNEIVKLGKNYKSACKAMKELAIIDGLHFAGRLSPEELENPEKHLVAIFLEYRKSSDPDRTLIEPFKMRFYRLNKNGVWTFKDPYQMPIGVKSGASNVKELIEDLSKITPFPSRLCALMSLPYQMKRMDSKWNVLDF